MKPRKLTLIAIALLASMLIGTVAIMVLSQELVSAKIRWDPRSFTWDATAPAKFNAQISLRGGYNPQTELNWSTIELENGKPPMTVTNSTQGKRIIAAFAGVDVKDALSAKLPTHMGMLIPGRYRVEVGITGELYTGEIVQGSGRIVVTVPEGPG